MPQNWAGSHTYEAPRIVSVQSQEDLVSALATPGRVHALGTRHSFTDLPDTDGTLIEMSTWVPPVIIEGDSVRVGAGTRYAVLAAHLEDAGRALHNTGSLPHINVGGATATGTHGSGDRNGVLTTAVRALTFADAAGAFHTVRRGDADFAALAVGAGAFGIVTELELETQPTYRVRQDIYAGVSWGALLDDIDTVTTAGDSVSVFTRWDDNSIVWVKKRVADDGEQPAETLLDGALADHELSPLGTGDNVTPLGVPGVWYQRLPHFRADREPSYGDEIQSEYFIDRAHAAPALAAIRAIADGFREHLNVTELRTAAADELWLSGAYQRESFIIHFTWLNHPEHVRAALVGIEAALAPFDARPHWGKLHLFDRERLEAVVPRLADARAVYERLDPDGRFVNDHLVRVGLREAR